MCCGCKCERFRTDEAGIRAIPSQRGRKKEKELGGKALAAPTLRSGDAERAHAQAWSVSPQRGVSLLPVDLRVRVSPRLTPYKFGEEKSQEAGEQLCAG